MLMWNCLYTTYYSVGWCIYPEVGGGEVMIRVNNIFQAVEGVWLGDCSETRF